MRVEIQTAKQRVVVTHKLLTLNVIAEAFEGVCDDEGVISVTLTVDQYPNNLEEALQLNAFIAALASYKFTNFNLIFSTTIPGEKEEKQDFAINLEPLKERNISVDATKADPVKAVKNFRNSLSNIYTFLKISCELLDIQIIAEKLRQFNAVANLGVFLRISRFDKVEIVQVISPFIRELTLTFAGSAPTYTSDIFTKIKNLFVPNNRLQTLKLICEDFTITDFHAFKLLPDFLAYFPFLIELHLPQLVTYDNATKEENLQTLQSYSKFHPSLKLITGQRRLEEGRLLVTDFIVNDPPKQNLHAWRVVSFCGAAKRGCLGHPFKRASVYLLPSVFRLIGHRNPLLKEYNEANFTATLAGLPKENIQIVPKEKPATDAQELISIAAPR